MNDTASDSSPEPSDPVLNQQTVTVSSVQTENSAPSGPGKAIQLAVMENMESRIMDMLKKLDTKVDNIKKDTEEIRREFDLKLQKVESKVDSNIEKVATWETSLNYAHTTIEKQKDSIDQMENR